MNLQGITLCNVTNKGNTSTTTNATNNHILLFFESPPRTGSLAGRTFVAQGPAPPSCGACWRRTRPRSGSCSSPRCRRCWRVGGGVWGVPGCRRSSGAGTTAMQQCNDGDNAESHQNRNVRTNATNMEVLSLLSGRKREYIQYRVVHSFTKHKLEEKLRAPIEKKK